MAKRATVDLAEDDEEEEEQTRHCARDEEILQTECWIETSENGQIMQDFNNDTTQDYRTKNMLTGKWTRINRDCQKFNAIYKHLERKNEENEADHIEVTPNGTR
ncbi:hypothetical protein Tco_1348562 [Tanacetum coccineum]